MADLVVIRKFLMSNSITGEESQAPSVYEKEKENKEIVKKTEVISSFNIISFIISCFAVYLSWTCNTAVGVHLVLKLIYAFFAFVFGFIYLIYYLLVRGDMCSQHLKFKF
jgi:hypothetical protein